MKKISCFIVVICMTLAAKAQLKTVYLNSKTVTCNPLGVQKECLQYKVNQSDNAWEVYSGEIDGFTYNPGYFYTLQVEQVRDIRPQWKMVKLISKTKSTQQQQHSDSVATIIKPPAILVGEWHFSRFMNSTDVANATLKNEVLQFDATSLKITGRATCNSFFGNYTLDSTYVIHFEAIGHTMMACEGLDTENKLFKAMEAVTNWSVEGNKLYLKNKSEKVIELTRTVSGKI